jgi:hypothetical protein
MQQLLPVVKTDLQLIRDICITCGIEYCTQTTKRFGTHPISPPLSKREGGGIDYKFPGVATIRSSFLLTRERKTEG